MCKAWHTIFKNVGVFFRLRIQNIHRMFENLTDLDLKNGIHVFSAGDREAIAPLLYFWDQYVSAGNGNFQYSSEQYKIPTIKVILLLTPHVPFLPFIFRFWSKKAPRKKGHKLKKGII